MSDEAADEEANWGPDSGLMIASPDEERRGVLVSIVCGQEKRHLEV
jgi:hypothetical protein